MRLAVLLEIAFGLAPSTLVYIGAFPVLLGSAFGIVLASVYSEHGGAPHIAARIIAILLSGPLALPVLWRASWHRARHGAIPAVSPGALFVCASGLGIATWLLIEVILAGPQLLYVYLLGAPILLAAHEVALRMRSRPR